MFWSSRALFHPIMFKIEFKKPGPVLPANILYLTVLHTPPKEFTQFITSFQGNQLVAEFLTEYKNTVYIPFMLPRIPQKYDSVLLFIVYWILPLFLGFPF